MPQLNTPLLFKPYFSETIWGGRRLLQQFGKQLPTDTLVGESWEVSAIAQRETVVANGPFQGELLSNLYRLDPCSLVGPQCSGIPEFPLLLKFIDANDRLSIQVHPDDVYARTKLHHPFGKTECWYIADAGTEGALGIGLKENITQEQLRNAIRDNTIGQLLHTVKVTTGEVYIIPAGTIHAILNDLIVYEVQQSSDVTFRLYDWHRKDAAGNYRKLAVEEGVDATDLKKRDCYRIKPLSLSATEYQHLVRAACSYFALEEFTCDHEVAFSLPNRSSCRIISVLSGEFELTGNNLNQYIGKGMTVFLPAALTSAEIKIDKQCHMLMTTIPGGEYDVAKDLAAAGYSQEVIGSLK